MATAQRFEQGARFSVFAIIELIVLLCHVAFQIRRMRRWEEGYGHVRSDNGGSSTSVHLSHSPSVSRTSKTWIYPTTRGKRMTWRRLYQYRLYSSSMVHVEPTSIAPLTHTHDHASVQSSNVQDATLNPSRTRKDELSRTICSECSSISIGLHVPCNITITSVSSSGD